MAPDDFDDDAYINTAGMGPRLPVQAKDLLQGLSSQILRSLLVAAPGDIPEEFGCSPDEAAVALDCCELAELPGWDEAALIDAATVGGNEEERVMWGHESRDRLARRISLAMKAEKAPEVMTPADGVLLLRRAGIKVFHQLLDAVAWLQLGSDATLPNYRLLKGIAEPQQTAPATDTATPAPVAVVSASGGVEPVTVKRWTLENLAELKSYREKHGTKKAAEFFRVSEQLIRQKLPSEKPQPKGYSAFTHRPK